MEWWFATTGILCLAAVAIATRSTVLAFLTLGLFMPLALHTLYQDFGRFWILMVLAFAVEIGALARHRALFTGRAGVAAERADGAGAAPSPPGQAPITSARALARS
ncbi:MAG: hypothetical protein AB1918_11705 [Pseudomonadota bacterium]